jgi:murein DD-endopeptidase MepM/ murein hydrolase activator NlpD
VSARALGFVGALAMCFALALPAAAPAQADPCLPIICAASPSPSPSPSPKKPASPSPKAPAAPGATTSKPKAAPTSAAPSPSPSNASVAARFENAAYLTDLLKVLNHPTAQEQPDLRHFRIDAGRAATAGESVSGGAIPGVELALFTAAWMFAIAGAIVLSARRRFRFRRARRAAALALLPVLALVTAGLRSPALPILPSSSAPSATAGVAFGPGLASTTTVDELDPTRHLLQPEAPTWNRLVTIERQVALHQAQLADQERQIQHLAASATVSPAATATNPGGAPGSPAPPADVDAVLGQLLDQHNATTQAYRQALQEEYELYRQAAQDQGLRDQLLAAAGHLLQSDGRDAVSYDIQVLQTQLTQESTINAAETKLSAIGSLSVTQLAAMRHHQPFIIPLEAPMVQGFGPTDFSLEPPLTYNGVFYPHFHTGLDIDGPIDSPIHAAADGVVALATATQDGAGHLVGYGNYVVIAHPDGFFSLYGHLNSVAVKEGQVVHQGEIIGREGSTGLSTGPHVHFEIRHGTQFLDPAPYLQGQIPG